ncbi:MAG: putative peptidoglycan binding domain protein [Firmicutes bacterium]|nr:putative peptidoglycan binding domain protein [Bacillota bacterium]
MNFEDLDIDLSAESAVSSTEWAGSPEPAIPPAKPEVTPNVAPNTKPDANSPLAWNISSPAAGGLTTTPLGLYNTNFYPKYAKAYTDRFNYNFEILKGPFNPVFTDKTLSYWDIANNLHLEYNPNGVLWRVNAAGIPTYEDLNDYHEQNRIIEAAANKTMNDVKNDSNVSELQSASVKTANNAVKITSIPTTTDPGYSREASDPKKRIGNYYMENNKYYKVTEVGPQEVSLAEVLRDKNARVWAEGQDGHVGWWNINKDATMTFAGETGKIIDDGKSLWKIGQNGKDEWIRTKAVQLPVQGAGGGAYNWTGPCVTPEFKAKVLVISNKLQMNPDDLMAIMAFESGFDPAQPNRAGSGAVGLIQFMPDTARGLGTSTDALAKMSALEQLDYVYAYLEPYAGQIHDIYDAYMAVLWPAAIGKPSDWHIFEGGSIAYDQNSGLDIGGKGYVTKADAAQCVVDRRNKYYSPNRSSTGLYQAYYSHADQRVYWVDSTGKVVKSWECRDAFVPGTNEEGQERGSLPPGKYSLTADEPGDTSGGVPYGTFYIHTGDPRYRDIHGGGSGLQHPFDPQQGWKPTFGCLRMQNVDGEEWSRMIRAQGSASLTVVQGPLSF